MRPELDSNRLSVFPLDSTERFSEEFDLGIYAIGFEARSSHVAKKLSAQCRKLIAIDLGGPEIHSYTANLAFASKLGAALVEATSFSLKDRSALAEQVGGTHAKVFIDISSMDRRTLATLLYHLLMLDIQHSMDLYVFYAPAAFTAPPRELSPVKFSGPINDLLGGGPRDPRLPTIMFIGLGYEVGLALGMVETFEPSSVFAYVPRGSDQRYDRQVNRANLPIFADGRYVTRVEYAVGAPTNTLLDLKQRILSVKDQARVVVIPLGPKMFAAISIICGYIYSPDICVWRVSSQIVEDTAQRVSDGTITGFRLRIEPA